MRYQSQKNYMKCSMSDDRMKNRFWSEIKNMINKGELFIYNDIGDVFLKKFGYRISKKKMSENRGVFFNSEGFAFFTKL